MQSADEDFECCVCFGATETHTPCGHLLCKHCWSVLPKPICPMCRAELGFTYWGVVRPSALEGDGDLPEEARNVLISGARPPSPRSQFLNAAGNRKTWRKRSSTSSALPSIIDANHLARTRRRPTVSESMLDASSPTNSSGLRRFGSDTFAEGVPLPGRGANRRRRVSLDDQTESHTAGFFAPPSGDMDRSASMPNVQPDIVSGPNSPTNPSSPSSSMPVSAKLSSSSAAGHHPRNLLRIDALKNRIRRMTLQESQRFTRHVAWLQEELMVNRADGAALSRVLRRRTADLFSRTPLHAMSRAGEVLGDITSYAERVPAIGGDGTPRRALEFRLSYFVYHPDDAADGEDGHGSTAGAEGSSILTLSQCHKEATDLISKRLITAKVAEVAAAHIKRWVEQAPLAHVHGHASVVRTLVGTMPELHTCLAARMHRLSLKRLDAGQLLGFVLVLLDFKQHDLPLLDSKLEQRLVQELCSGIRSWGTGRLAEEMGNKGALVSLCRQSETVKEAVGNTLQERLQQGVGAIARSLRKDTDYERVKREIMQWGLLARDAGSSGMLVLEPAVKRSIIDTLSDCTERCMASPELIGGVENIRVAQMALLLCTGGL